MTYTEKLQAAFCFFVIACFVFILAFYTYQVEQTTRLMSERSYIQCPSVRNNGYWFWTKPDDCRTLER